MIASPEPHDSPDSHTSGGWRDLLAQAGSDADDLFDAFRRRLEQRLSSPGAYSIVIYRGYGTAQAVRVWGRVLRGSTRGQEVGAVDRPSYWQNILATYRRYASDEVPDVPLEVRIDDQIVHTVSDGEGYFDVTLPMVHAVTPHSYWLPVWVTAGAEQSAPEQSATLGEAFIVGDNARFGIISDIDDTVLVTNAANLLQAARHTFLENARSRLPFAGVAELYRALQSCGNATGCNPLFYVSSSAWNLYDLLVDFMTLHDLPGGPLFLQDYGIDSHKLIVADHASHKITQIRAILDMYPALTFILIGDSGQHDPEIYTRLIREFPQRIRAILIRDVSAETRDQQVHSLAQQSVAAGVPMHLVADSAQAAVVLQELGLLDGHAVEQIEAAV